MKRSYEKYLAWKKRSKPIKKRKRKSRVGKLGIVRLVGPELEQLREMVWERAGRRCEDCRRPLTLDGENEFSRMQLCHIQSRGAGGSDTQENTKCKCLVCHRFEHQPKAVPSKSAAVTEEASGG